MTGKPRPWSHYPSRNGRAALPHAFEPFDRVGSRQEAALLARLGRAPPANQRRTRFADTLRFGGQMPRRGSGSSLRSEVQGE